MKTPLRETQWAEMSPDVYAGKNCDEVSPRWTTHCDGDKGDGADFEVLKLAANTFPPGTTVVISEPVCPDCGELRCFNSMPDVRGFPKKCDCGFDWAAWTLDQYS